MHAAKLIPERCFSHFCEVQTYLTPQSSSKIANQIFDEPQHLTTRTRNVNQISGEYTMRSIRNLMAATAIVGAGFFATAQAYAADIVDTAIAAGNFKTLVAAVQAAGLVDTLKGAGPFTVFAPTDEAFAKLPAGTVESLLKPENKDKLIAILTYHVVAGKVMAADVAGKKTMAKSVQGSEITVDGTKGVMVDAATVLTADIAADNGVIHVIDAVIMPKM
jgi:uncharacterized surface protein with fasciclin (FAS1) repeats